MSWWKQIKNDGSIEYHNDMGGAALHMIPEGCTPCSDAEADAALNPPTPLGTLLAEAKAKQTNLINAGSGTAIAAGFTSSVLGAPHTYTCKIEDQAYLASLIQLGIDNEFTCVDGAGAKVRPMHTHAQLQALQAAGHAHVNPRLAKARALKDQIEAVRVTDANPVAAVEAVVWVFP